MSDIAEQLRRALRHPTPGSSDFDLNPDVTLPANRKLRPAAVLVAFRQNGTEAELLLTKRSSALKHHPGQIAFPGGKQDAGDSDLTATALREAREEVGLPSENAVILGALPSHETVTGFTVTPIVSMLTTGFDERPEKGEVDEVFWVPFDHIRDPGNYSIQSRRWRGTQRHYYTAAFGPYYIWGATARMLRGLAERLA